MLEQLLLMDLDRSFGTLPEHESRQPAQSSAAIGPRGPTTGRLWGRSVDGVFRRNGDAREAAVGGLNVQHLRELTIPCEYR